MRMRHLASSRRNISTGEEREKGKKNCRMKESINICVLGNFHVYSLEDFTSELTQEFPLKTSPQWRNQLKTAIFKENSNLTNFYNLTSFVFGRKTLLNICRFNIFHHRCNHINVFNKVHFFKCSNSIKFHQIPSNSVNFVG